MPLAVEINMALGEQNCQKIGSERVKLIFNDIAILFKIIFLQNVAMHL